MLTPQHNPSSLIHGIQECLQKTFDSVRFNVFLILGKSKDIQFTYANESDFSKIQIDANRLKEVGKITKQGMLQHLFTHYLLLFLGKGGIFYIKDELVVREIDAFLESDKYGMEYDLYLLFVSGVGFAPEILNFEFVGKNKAIMENHLERMITNFDENNKKYVRKVFQKQMKQTLSSHKEQLYMGRYVAFADLLGLMEIGFVKNFSISAHMIELIEKILYHSKPLFISEIIQEVFGNAKSIEVTQDNYEELKAKFRLARENFLVRLGVEDFGNKKEISRKLMERFGE